MLFDLKFFRVVALVLTLCAGVCACDGSPGAAPLSLVNTRITHYVTAPGKTQPLVSLFGAAQLNIDLGFDTCQACPMAGGSYLDVHQNNGRVVKVQTLLDPNMGEIGAAQVEDSYYFTTANEGLWERKWQWGKQQGQYKGRFALAAETYPGFAPSALSGLKAQLTFLSITSLLPPEQTPNFTVAYHEYLSLSAFSVDLGDPNAKPSGLYEYQKGLPNTGLDTGFNDTYQAPYSIAYEFTSPRAGIFKEIFADGLFVWTGQFSLNTLGHLRKSSFF